MAAPPGERHGLSRLTADDVRLIRAVHAEGIGYWKLAHKFDVGMSTIRDVCTFRTWKHIEAVQYEAREVVG